MSNKIVSRAIRNSARGEQCTLEIPFVCCYQRETVVFCHFPDEHGGMGTKGSDLNGGYGCHACHDVVDRRVWNAEFEEDREFYLRRSNQRMIHKLVEKDILKVKGR